MTGDSLPPPPPPPGPPPDGPAGEPARSRRGIALVIVVVIVVALYVIGRSDAEDDAPRSNDPRPAVIVPTCEPVRYYVEGSARQASLTMERPTGTEQITVNVPLRSTTGELGLGAGCFEPSGFVYISAQNEGESGTVTCRIERDGIEVSRATSSGAYVIATCSD